jgi:predicted enzyme related to lactoylglutathione lyase
MPVRDAAGQLCQTECFQETARLRIKLTSVLVDDQSEALRFYTGVLGFIKKTDQPAGEYRWLTVTSAEGPNDLELLLEPNANPAGKTYQKALRDQGIPAAMFFVDDVRSEFERLQGLGVSFIMPPTSMGFVTIATFDDTCGNLIQIAQAQG